MMDTCTKLIQISHDLAQSVAEISFDSSVSYIYNPLIYAWAPHVRYLERYGVLNPEILLVGMNPGPFGMAQTGIPFGDVTMVRDWMGIEEPVTQPDVMHPKRPISGFKCTRSEVSGTRLWGWARDRHGTPVNFFSRFFVVNYCPLCFMESSGRNRTPDKLESKDRRLLEIECNTALKRTIDLICPRFVLGIGAYAEKHIREISGITATIGRLPHPSPANPAANAGWADAADAALAEIGIDVSS